MQDFIALLEPEERYAWFQQDGATARTAQNSMRVILEFFDDRIISKSKWPARSPDLSPTDFFLCGVVGGWLWLLENNVY